MNRRQRQCMLAYPYDERYWMQMHKPAVVQPKLDGIRCIAIRNDDDTWTLTSSTGKVITSMPHINQDLQEIFKEHHEVTKVDGELYKSNWNFNKISSVVNRINPADNHNQIMYWMFDLPTRHDPLLIRLKTLARFMGYFCMPLSYALVSTEEQVYEHLHQYIQMGYEGIMIKDPVSSWENKRSTEWLKLKPHKSDTYKIIGFLPLERQDGTIEKMVGSIQVTTSLGEIFFVGSGSLFTDEQRRQLWTRRQELIGQYLVVKYQEITPRGVPRFPVAIDIVKPKGGNYDSY